MQKNDKMLQNSEREPWLDLAKAIGIVLVLWAHALPKDDYMWIWINSFHMPLFFCISGYQYVCRGKFCSYIVKKVRTLWIPFEVSSVVTYTVFLLIGQVTLSVKEIAKIVLMVAPGPLLGATWFIPVLLFTSVIYDLLYRLTRKLDFEQEYKTDIVLTIVALACLIVGIKMSLPYRGSVILRSVFFFQLGQLIRKYLNNKKYDLILGIILMSTVSIIAIFNTTSYLNNTYTSVPLFVLAAIGGSIGVSMLCRWAESQINIEKLKIVLYIGMNTKGPLIWQFVAFKIVTAVQILIYGLSWSKILDFPVIYEYAHGIWILLDVIIGLFFSTWIYKIVNRPVEKYIDKLLARRT